MQLRWFLTSGVEMATDENMRHILDLAKACVHRGQAYQALAYLRDVQPDIDSRKGTSFWAEHEVIYAGALAGMNDPGAGTAFEDALKRCTELSEPDLLLTTTAHIDYAKYLAGRHAIKRAIEHYRHAEKIAETLGHEECVAHCQMCIIGLELVETGSPQLSAFQNLQKASKEGYTEIEQREAWIDYMQELEGLASQLVATRGSGRASADYFRGVLSKIRRSRK
jgi:hypothetical protein